MEPIKLGSLTLYPFGLLMAAAALGALLLTAWKMKKAGLKKETAGWFALLAVPLCFVLARLGFCLFVIDQIMGNEDPGMIFRVNEGGFLLWGALGGGLLAAWITGKITKQPAGKIMDSAILGNVHHVDGNHHRNFHVGKLARKEQVAFQVRRINDIDNQARFAAEQVVDSSAFVFGICEQSVSTRKVHQANLAVAQFKVTFFLFDSHAGPVTHMLTGTRKGVKESRLTAVRVTGNCNRQKFSSSHYTLLSLSTFASSLRSESL